MGKLLDSISDLSVSQFVAFTFLAAPLFYEAIHKQSLGWSKFALLFIFIVNGMRIFLSNWEVEEDNAYKLIIKENQSTFVKSEWLLRAIWLFLVYMFPVLLHYQGETIFKIVIPILLGLIFLLLIIWDFQIQRFIKNKKNGFTNANFNEALFSKDQNRFFDVVASTLRIKWRDRKIEKFEHKVVIWKWLEIINFVLIFSWCFIVIIFDQKVLDHFSSIFFFVTFLTFVFELLLNWVDYWKRILWCFFTSILVSFFFLGIDSLFKLEDNIAKSTKPREIEIFSNYLKIHADSVLKTDTCAITK